MIDLDINGGPDFAVAFYRWALEQWSEEVEHGFTLLESVKNEDCISLIQLLESLPVQERLRVSQLLTKRFHPQALTILGESLSTAEINQLSVLDAERSRARNRLGILQSMKSGPRLNRTLLKKHVREEIEAVVGNDRAQISGNVWEYRTLLGWWRIDTTIEFGGRDFAMSYRHDVVAVRDKEVCLASYLSAPAWLGVNSSGDWSGLSEADIPEAAAGLALVCKRFIEAIPSLLPM